MSLTATRHPDRSQHRSTARGRMPRAHPAPVPARFDVPAWVAWGGVTLVAIALFAQLAPMAARAVLNTDECFHAHASRWIAAHGTLPVRIPELYGGMPYFYPPLLHLIGAGWVKLFGLPTLPLLNAVLYAVLIAALVTVPVPGLAATPRRWAAWLVIANAALAVYSVRFYAEMLTCLLGLLSALLLLRVNATRRVRDGALLGIVAGLGMLAKNSAVLLPVLIAGWLLIQLYARRPGGIRAGLVALGLTLALGAPLLIRNQVLYGSPFYPAGAPDIDPWIQALNVKTFSGDAGSYLKSAAQALGPWVVGAGVIGIVLAVAKRRRDLHTVLLIGSAAAIGAALLSPIHESRHVLPAIAIVALSGSVVIHQALVRRDMVRGVLELALAAAALVSVLTLGDKRTPLDVPPGLMEAYVAIHDQVPENGTVLSLWTYDTFYHSGRAATWPIPYGQGDRSPAALFRETDPDRFLAELDRLGIAWLLVPRSPGDVVFVGNNYPNSFISCVVPLLDRRALRIAWGSSHVALLQRLK